MQSVHQRTVNMLLQARAIYISLSKRGKKEANKKEAFNNIHM